MDTERYVYTWYRVQVESPADRYATNKAVLVVDDNAINRKIMQRMMSIIGIDCETAATGQDALNMFKNQTFCLVLMDLNMSPMDGFECTKIIRQFDKLTPIIAFTANVLDDERQKAYSVGMNYFLSKPVKRADILHVLRKFVPSIDVSNTSPVTSPTNRMRLLQSRPLLVTQSEDLV